MPSLKSSRFIPLTLSLSFSFLLSSLFFINLHTGAAAPHAIYYVNINTGNDDSNDCLSAGNPCATIAAALDKASDGDTIEIAAGVYPEYELVISDDITLQGAGQNQTIIDGQLQGRVLTNNATTTISDLTIRNGRIMTDSSLIFDTGGGGIFNQVTLNLVNTTLSNHSVNGSGGAIFNNGDLYLDHSEVLSSTSDGFGGGIYVYLGTVTIHNSLIADNTAFGSQGGGIYSAQPITLTDTTIRGNEVATFGGGLHTSDRTVLERVTLTDNRSTAGAAHFAQFGTITYTNVTVSGNRASNNQGGIYISGPAVSIAVQNSTIANNYRTNSIGTGNNGLVAGNNSSATVINTIFANNGDRSCGSNNITSLGHNLSLDFTCPFTATGDLQGIDPLLGDLADNGGATLTHALDPNSPAIDAGDNTTCPTTDQRGVTRPFDGDNDSTPTCDIGAFEARAQATIEDISLLEGNTGTTNAVFTVTLSPPAAATTIISYTTAAGTATSGADYTPVDDALTFTAGQSSQQITIPIIGDLLDEPDETFDLILTTAAEVDLLNDGRATATIIDNDGLPSLTIADQTVLEGNSGTVTAEFVVTLSPAATETVTVDFETLSDSATAAEDFTTQADTLTFAPGETSQTIPVLVNGDDIDEGDSEQFIVELSNPTNAAVTDAQALGTITDDDSARLSQTVGPQVFEGNSGTTPAVFTVTLSAPADFPITVDYEISPGFGETGATAGEDYIDISGTLTFDPGDTTQTYTVQIIGDTDSEADERFGSLIKNANAPITVNGSSATILNDDGATLSIFNQQVDEGDSGTVAAVFEVELSPAVSETVTVNYATVNGTATAGQDFVGLRRHPHLRSR